MSQSEDRGGGSPEPSVEPATLRLEQGLESCRLVLRNYRVLIGEEFPPPEIAVRPKDGDGQ